MALAILLTLQAAAAPASAPPASEPFDLAKVEPSRDDDGEGCRRASGEIVVCGRPAADYPLDEWEKIFATRPIVAERSILGGSAKARAYVESVGVGGFVSKRAMVGIKFPF